jgi:hypothetical protein
MPDLSKLPVPQYQADQPYHWEYDNLPLQVLAQRDEIINGEVDNQSKILGDSAGTQGTLSNRLNQSIDEDGNLLSTAVDESLHNIAKHTDGSITVDSDELDHYVSDLGYSSVANPVPFVRMLESERDKLALIASEATNFAIQANIPSNITVFNSGILELSNSTTINWEFTAPNILSPVLAISTDFAHRHYYDLEPITTDYLNYKVTSISTPYIEGSLRVYINGVRLSEEYQVYYPSNPVSTWSLNSYTSDYSAGTFVLDYAITSNDIIRIDFDLSLT